MTVEFEILYSEILLFSFVRSDHNKAITSIKHDNETD